MALDDNEQKILADIERQFYDEDPDLARAVRDINRPVRIGVRVSLIGVVAGLAIVVGFFASNTLVAFVGFAVLVASATSLVSGLRSRGWGTDRSPSEEELTE